MVAMASSAAALCSVLAEHGGAHDGLDSDELSDNYFRHMHQKHFFTEEITSERK